MLLALSPGAFPPWHPDLQAFAQDPEWVGLPDRYRFYVALYVGPLARFNGGAVLLHRDPRGEFVSDYVLEFAHPPFAYVLCIDEKARAVKTGCISEFASLDYHQRVDVEIPMQIGFGHTILPLDYRSQAKINADRTDADAA